MTPPAYGRCAMCRERRPMTELVRRVTNLGMAVAVCIRPGPGCAKEQAARIQPPRKTKAEGKR
jgi:hypothetical protein